MTDIARSSYLSEQYPQEYLRALKQHDQVIERAVTTYGGKIHRHTGDGYVALFETAKACVNATLELVISLGQLGLLAAGEQLLVRVALHGGELRPAGRDFYSIAMNRARRICEVCNPGQVLLSDAIKATLPKAFDDCELLDLGQHHLRDLAEPEQLYQLGSKRFSRHEFPPLATLDNRPNNLVMQPNAFIGRSRELEELAELLRGEKRLITIIAPGGYGKTRLAAQLCANLLHCFERGVFMVYLAAVRESLGVPLAIASALGFQFNGSRDPAVQLGDYLRAKELLLCLDNSEHLPDSASLVAQLLAGAPKLKALITSREPLNIQGEQIYILEPLRLAAGAGEFSEAELLFADRAALVNRCFALAPENSAAVRHFCEHLAGIPLALELAAAWMDSFTLAELHDELTDRLELVARTSDLAARHQSLTACLDWSWNLLGEQLQEALMRLSVFRGGFCIEAAAAVLGLQGMQLRGTLAKLSDKSWLYRRQVEGHTRYFLRDMLAHEYAFARLEETRDAEDSLFERAVRTHASHFAELVEREGPRLDGSGRADGGAAQLAAIGVWRLELDNINEALDNAIQRGADAWLLTFAAHFKKYFSKSGTSFDMRSCYERILTSKQWQENSALLFHVKLGLGMSQWRLGKQRIAKELLEESLQLAHQLGDRSGQVNCLNSLAILVHEQGDYARAADLHLQALTLAREISYRVGEARSLANLANIHKARGEYSRAAELQGQALALNREIGDRWAEALTLANLGNTQREQGNHIDAAVMHHLALTIRREIGDRAGEANSLGCLAVTLYEQDDFARAADLQNQALALERETGNRAGEAHCLCNLGRAHHLLGNNVTALELLGQSLAIRREIGDRSGEALSLCGLASVFHSLGEYFHAAQLRSQELAVLQEIGAQTRLARTCAVSAATLAVLGDYRSLACALYGGLKQAAAFKLKLSPEEQQALGVAQARLAAAVANSAITAKELAQWKVQAEAMRLDALAEFVLSELGKLNADLPVGSFSQQAEA